MKIQDMTNTAPGWRPTQTEVVSWLADYPLGVVSTLNTSGHPQAATVAFSETAELELIIGTSEDSRKASNIESDDRVAFTVTDSEARYTFQYEGTARKLGKEAFAHYADHHYEKLPASAPFRDVAGQCFYVLTPRWARFSDCSSYPWTLTEYTIDNARE
ncbi:MAG TPA: pyridoxamine 5'-phosphate oxidase family protein [Candidatus Nitrosotenuis sp.]|nr:pyridoxamine 5'-phosphate oxidase family protein [Candidatus Nitrosotenuis sp.]